MAADLDTAPPDLYEGGVSTADFDDLPEPPEGSDSGNSDDDAPHGYTRDRETGELRPKRKPGRPRHPKDAGELRASGPPEPPPADRPPGPVDRKPRTTASSAAPSMPRAGTIANGVNKLYRRAGRIVRGLDWDIGQAIIECTRPDPEDPDTFPTVGEAWENLARVNPNIRRWLLQAIAGGAWSDLIMAHAPIALAIIAKPRLQKLIPQFMRSMTQDDGFGDDEDKGPFEGLSEEDAREMAAQAGMDLDRMAAQAAQMAGRMGGTLTAEQARKAAEAAMAQQGGVPAAYRRQQPKNQTRAQRAKAHK